MLSLNSFINEHMSNDDLKAFIIIKPGFLSHKDEIFDYINKNGFMIRDITDPFKLTDNQAKQLYGCHSKEDWYDDLCKYMTSGEIVAAEYTYDYGKNPGTNTISLMKDIKHHFREKYGKDDMRNCMHSSDSLKNVYRESKIIFEK